MDENESNEFHDFGELAAAMAAMNIRIELAPIARACPGLIKKLKSFHPLKAAATFGALLTEKSLQPNCLRLETLVHLCVAAGHGTRAPKAQILTQGYTMVGSICGHLEDPPEDIFVGNIYSNFGNYLVLEGIWESGTFYLQRFVNLVDSLPDSGDFRSIRNSIHALLKVSDLICKRAGLERNELGSPSGDETLPRKLAEKSNKLRQLMQISFEDLEKSKIDIEDLLPFIYDPERRSELLTQSITNSTLEACPLAAEDGLLYLLLPTAISPAIRRFFISALGNGGNRDIFLSQLGREYSQLFSQTPMLGTLGHRIRFVHMPWGSVCSTCSEVDAGRYLNLIFYMDTLEDFDQDGFSGMNFGSEKLVEELDHATEAMQAEASKRAGFRNGITLLIGCGIGRSTMLLSEAKPLDNWKFEHLSAPDYLTLSRVKGMEPLHLWRILEMQSRLESMNVWLQNINGLLNLFGWADSLRGHLIPHADIPDMTPGESALHLAITQNSLIDLRHQVAKKLDAHVEQFIDGTWRLVLTEGASHFDEDQRQPLYAHLQRGPRQRPLGACITPLRCWWYELASPEEGPDTTNHERWKMLGVWLTRSAAPLEHAFATGLGEGPVLWRCIFDYPPSTISLDTPGTTLEASDAIRTTVDMEHRTILLCIGPGFDRAIFHTDNIAETALVSAFIGGVAQLANDKNADIERLIRDIVPNREARHAHAFPMQNFRDHMDDLHGEEPIKISQFDDASLKIGMGWLVRSPSEGGDIIGKSDCAKFLNSLVKNLESELCEDLHRFNRTALISKLLLNHELASASRERWHRTAAAVLALRDDKEAALAAMRNHELGLNGVLQPTRNLIEMANCESILVGGEIPGALDISRLLTKASQLFHLGGWSDLIRWDCLNPHLVVQPLGDVHANHDFMEGVLDSFGNATSEYRYLASARNYAKNLAPLDPTPDSKGKIEAKFLDAWSGEFGLDIDSYRRFLDAIENFAIEQQEPVINIRRSKLIDLADSTEAGQIILSSLTLVARDSWRNLPEGYEDRDIAPWRFRRRLSLLRRPILQITLDDDPMLIVAPGLLREGFASTVSNYFYASYPDWHLGPTMRKYAGFARNRDGIKFNKEVAEKMTELGWNAQPEVNITKILRKSFDQNYGDVDVLAYCPEKNRVLVMECKDLQFRKTYGEIAEQLSDFLGQTSADGKRDLLRKHLDRVDVLRNHQSAVGNYLNLSGEFSIDSIIVFRHPVPMQFSEGPIRDSATIYIFSGLEALKINQSVESTTTKH